MCKKLMFLLFSIAILLGQSSHLLAVVVPWSGGGADNLWSTAANWGGGVAPTAADDVDISVANETALIDGTVAAAGNIVRIGVEAGPTTLNITGGSLTAVELNQAIGGGSANANFSTINVSGGSVNVSSVMRVGGWGKAFLNVTGGSVTAGSWFVINDITAFGTAGGGHVQLDSGSIDVLGNFVLKDFGSMDITGGTFSFNTLAFSVNPTVEGLIANGFITAYGGTGNVIVNVDQNGITHLSAVVPEPATMLLLGLGGLGMLRKKRNS